MNQQKNIGATSPLTAVTINEVAALAVKIGTEIWGQEQFDSMMNPSDHPEESVPVTGKASASGKFTRDRDKKESA